MTLAIGFQSGISFIKKLDWYEKHDIEVLDKFSQMHLEYILGDKGILDGRTLRGLQPKLDLVFNYNKRNITVFLVHKLLKNQDDDQEHYLKAADFYYNSLQTGGATAWCAQFGYRSVVWRKLLDLIRQSPLIQDGILSQYREESAVYHA